MRLIDADKLKRKAQKVGTEAWKMNLTAKVETTLNQFIDWIDEQPTIQPEKAQLSKESATSDLISRQAAIGRAVSIPMFGRDVKMVAVSEIKNLPPAQPEPPWIPVSERLPEVHESGNSVSGIYMQSNPVLVYGTCEYEDNAQFHVVTYCDDLDGNTYWSTELDAITVSGVIAWMPLPEAYKPNNK